MKNIRKKSFTFFKEVLSTIVNNQQIFKSFGSWKKTNDNFSIHDLIGNVEKAKDEVSAEFYSNLLMEKVETLKEEELIDFFILLSEEYEINSKELQNSLNKYNLNRSPENLSKIIDDSEPRRVEIFRRMNLSERGTIRLVKLRENLINLINLIA